LHGKQTFMNPLHKSGGEPSKKQGPNRKRGKPWGPRLQVEIGRRARSCLPQHGGGSFFSSIRGIPRGAGSTGGFFAGLGRGGRDPISVADGWKGKRPTARPRTRVADSPLGTGRLSFGIRGAGTGTWGYGGLGSSRTWGPTKKKQNLPGSPRFYRG